MTGEENIHVGSSHPKVFFEVNVLKFKIYFFLQWLWMTASIYMKGFPY